MLINWIEIGYPLSQFWTSPLFHILFCFFLTCIQISQEVGKVVWYSYLFKNFPPFLVIHTVKGFSIVNEEEVDVFWNSLAFSMIQQMFCCYWDCTQVLHFWLFGWLWRLLHFFWDSCPQWWIQWSSELNSPIPVHFSSLISNMSMFPLAISCLTTSNLPWLNFTIIRDIGL